MRNFKFAAPVAAVITGIVLMFLRRYELKTVFDPETNLALPMAPVTIAITVVIALIIILSLILGFRVGRASLACRKETALSSGSGVLTAVEVIAGAAFAVGGVLYYFEAVRTFSAGLFVVIFAVVAVITGICEIVAALALKKESVGSGVRAASVLLPLFMCLWLVWLYKQNSKDSVILYYCLPCISLMAGAVSSFYFAGFANGRDQKKWASAFGLIALAVCIAALADFTAMSELIMLSALIVLTLIKECTLLSNVK